MPITSWSIPGSDDQPIFGNTHTPDAQPVGVLIISHGFKGYKDYGFVPYLAACAAKRGLIAHRFNFSHSGMTNNIETFERPELFQRDTWGRQIHDLGRVACAIEAGELAGGGLPQAWFGHSRGGVTTLLTAARVFDPSAYQRANPLPNNTPSPEAIITAGSPDVAAGLDDVQRRIMHKQGFLVSHSTRTTQDLLVGLPWLEEIEANPDAYDPCAAIARVRCPVLVLHGDQDETIAPTAAFRFQESGGDHVSTRIMEGASHTFNARNPLPTDTPPPNVLQEMIDLANDFAAKAIRNKRQD